MVLSYRMFICPTMVPTTVPSNKIDYTELKIHATKLYFKQEFQKYIRYRQFVGCVPLAKTHLLILPPT
jgi:hypothetical protein